MPQKACNCPYFHAYSDGALVQVVDSVSHLLLNC
jgi:hypothetical protein